MLQSPHQRYDIQLRSCFAYWGFDHEQSYITSDDCTDIGTAKPRKMCYRVYVGTIKPLKIRLMRGSGTRYVAVVVPRAKLGLTKCPAVRGASEACDRNRDFAMKPFPSQHSHDSYNQPQV